MFKECINTLFMKWSYLIATARKCNLWKRYFQNVSESQAGKLILTAIARVLFNAEFIPTFRII